MNARRGRKRRGGARGGWPRPPARARGELAPRRRARLREHLRQAGVARVDELCRALRASPATVRRDLEELAGLGQLRRVHGGAVALESRLEEPPFEDKAGLAARQKRRIAEAALRTVLPGQTLYLDGGSTVLELARLLRERGDVTVATNSLPAAAELAGRGPRLIVVGGELRRRSQALVGPLAAAALGELHFDRAFMGTLGLDPRGGLTTTDPGEAHAKRQVMARSREVVLLADGSKIGKVLFVRFGALRDVQTLITDRRAGRGFVRAAEKAGVRVVRV